MGRVLAHGHGLASQPGLPAALARVAGSGEVMADRPDLLMAWAIVALLAVLVCWDLGRKLVAYQRARSPALDKLDHLERELAEHKKVHAKAIDNLVIEMRSEVGEVKTRSSLALDRANAAQQRRFGR
jgi:hypothetical protein